MTELRTLASLANAQTLVLNQHIFEHELYPRVGDDVMLLSDIRQIEQTVKKMEKELEKESKEND